MTDPRASTTDPRASGTATAATAGAPRRLARAEIGEAIAIEGISSSTRTLLTRDLDRAGHLWLGLRARGRDALIGLAGAIDGAGDLHVVEVAVDPAVRRRGVGTRLVRALLVAGREQLGSHAATLEVRASNHGAQALYRLLGFRSAGARPGYYPPGDDGRREDAIIMWRDELASLDPGSV